MDTITHFNTAKPWIFSAEGGLAIEQPADRGSDTNWGISLRFLKTVPDADLDGFLDGDLNRDGRVDRDDIIIMTREQAAELYHRYFWDAAKCGYMQPAVALCLFDATVHHHPITAARLVQLALGVAPDGVIGKNTLSAASGPLPADFFPDYASHRALLMHDIVRADSSQATWLRGWFARLFRLQEHLYKTGLL